LTIAGGLFVFASLCFVWRKRNAGYAGEDTWAMKAAALCGLAAILLLLWGRALRRKESKS
jgi:hypothetical protein